MKAHGIRIPSRQYVPEDRAGELQVGAERVRPAAVRTLVAVAVGGDLVTQGLQLPYDTRLGPHHRAKDEAGSEDRTPYHR
jgi:hypothetical protein